MTLRCKLTLHLLNMQHFLQILVNLWHQGLLNLAAVPLFFGTISAGSTILASDVAFNGAMATISGTVAGTGAYVSVPWNTESFDTNTYHDNVTNNTRLTAPSNGKYIITAFIDWGNLGSAHTAATKILLNGATIIGGSNIYGDANGARAFATTTTLQNLIAGDYVECQIVVDGSGGSIQTTSYFAITRIVGS